MPEAPLLPLLLTAREGRLCANRTLSPDLDSKGGTARLHARDVVAFVCDGVETGAPLGVKTGGNAVILFRR